MWLALSKYQRSPHISQLSSYLRMRCQFPREMPSKWVQGYKTTDKSRQISSIHCQANNNESGLVLKMAWCRNAFTDSELASQKPRNGDADGLGTDNTQVNYITWKHFKLSFISSRIKAEKGKKNLPSPTFTQNSLTGSFDEICNAMFMTSAHLCI